MHGIPLINALDYAPDIKFDCFFTGNHILIRRVRMRLASHTSDTCTSTKHNSSWPRHLRASSVRHKSHLTLSKTIRHAGGWSGFRGLNEVVVGVISQNAFAECAKRQKQCPLNMCELVRENTWWVNSIQVKCWGGAQLKRQKSLRVYGNVCLCLNAGVVITIVRQLDWIRLQLLIQWPHDPFVVVSLLTFATCEQYKC